MNRTLTRPRSGMIIKSGERHQLITELTGQPLTAPELRRRPSYARDRPSRPWGRANAPEISLIT
ncbi:hypothetical protein ACFXJM_37845 [Streptomyces massasporeus]